MQNYLKQTTLIINASNNNNRNLEEEELAHKRNQEEPHFQMQCKKPANLDIFLILLVFVRQLVRCLRSTALAPKPIGFTRFSRYVQCANLQWSQTHANNPLFPRAQLVVIFAGIKFNVLAPPPPPLTKNTKPKKENVLVF